MISSRYLPTECPESRSAPVAAGSSHGDLRNSAIDRHAARRLYDGVDRAASSYLGTAGRDKQDVLGL